MKNILTRIRDDKQKLFRVSIFLVTLLIIVYVFPRQAKFKYEFTKGKPWMHETIIAPFDFSILKSSNQIDREKDIVHAEHMPVFNYNADIFEIKAEEYINQFEDKWMKEKNVKKDKRFTFLNIFKKNKVNKKTRKYDLAIFGYDKLESIYKKGIIQLNGDLEYKNDLNILLKRGSVAEKSKIDNFYSITSVANEINSIKYIYIHVIRINIVKYTRLVHIIIHNESL